MATPIEKHVLEKNVTLLAIKKWETSPFLNDHASRLKDNIYFVPNKSIKSVKYWCLFGNLGLIERRSGAFFKEKYNWKVSLNVDIWWCNLTRKAEFFSYLNLLINLWLLNTTTITFEHRGNSCFSCEIWFQDCQINYSTSYSSEIWFQDCEINYSTSYKSFTYTHIFTLS